MTKIAVRGKSAARSAAENWKTPGQQCSLGFVRETIAYLIVRAEGCQEHATQREGAGHVMKAAGKGGDGQQQASRKIPCTLLAAWGTGSGELQWLTNRAGRELDLRKDTVSEVA